MLLKVSPVKGVRRFNIRGKLSPRYIGSYEIIKKKYIVTYRLDLPAKLEHAYNSFHISKRRKYVPDPNLNIIAELVEVAENLVYKERPLSIFNYKFKQLRNKSILFLKVLWANHTSFEATWETEEDMRSKHPYLFEVNLMFLSNLQVSRKKPILRGGEECNGLNLKSC